MIFNKPNITYQDVVSFCESQQLEGVHLDYKKDFSNPRSIAKTICAFANTMGGTILVGVDDKDNKPMLPAMGMDYNDKLNTQVLDIVLGNIYNPIIPDVKVCEPIGGKTFVIINVPESNIAPHAIDNDTKIYYRTGDISNPEKLEMLADVRKIEWLLNRRKKSEEFRKQIKEEAWERFCEMAKRKKEPFPHHHIYLQGIPLFPRESLISPKKIKNEIIDKIKTESNLRGSIPPRDFSAFLSLSIPNGIITDWRNYTYDRVVPYCELNEFGFYSFCEDVERDYEKNSMAKEREKCIYMTTILSYIDLYLESLQKLYTEIGFWGIIELTIKIKTKDISIIRIGCNNWEDVSDKIKHPLADFEDVLTFSFSELQYDRKSIFMGIARKIYWDTGFSEVSDELLEKFLKDNNRG